MIPAAVLVSTACPPIDENPPGTTTTTNATTTSTSPTTTTPPSSGSVTRIAAGGATAAVISRNGRYVAYASTSATPGTDGNGSGLDIFLVDRQTSTTTRVTSGNGTSDSPSVADDGSVVFRSAATDLAGTDTNGHVDVFRWTSAGGVARVTDSLADVTAPLLSADGATVVFGGPTSLTSPTPPTRTATFSWSPVAPSVLTQFETLGTDGSVPVAVGADGVDVLLAEPGRLTLSSNPTATPVLVAAAPASPPAPQVTTFSVAPHALAADGDVVFSVMTYSLEEASSELTFQAGELRRWNRQDATSSVVPATGVPGAPVQSGDGQRVIHPDHAGVVVDQDDGGPFLPAAIRAVGVAGGPAVVVAGSPRAAFGTVSADGRYVAFVSTATDLALPDANGSDADVYVWDRGA